MQYRIDPKTGKELSALGFGCMRFPRGMNAQIQMEKAEQLLVSAIERGVNYLDTAYVYPGSEGTVGKILAKHGLRKKVCLATKLPHGKCKRYEDFDRLFAIQQERLQTEYFDYYLIHNLTSVFDWKRLLELDIERWIAEKKAGGQIRQIGFSFHGAQNEFLALLDMYPWEFVQIQYNYMDETCQAGRAGLEKAAAMGLPIIVMEPLLGGKLATGLPSKAVKLFKEAGGARSPAEWALRWLWDQPEVTVILSGMNAMEQLDENLRAAEDALPGCLTERDGALFEKAIAIFREVYRVPCTGCNYCMPCPQGVNIPGCFAAYNASYAISYPEGIKQYVMNTTVVGNAENNATGYKCVQCGACEKKCPQGIGIMKELTAVNRRLEPLPLKFGFKMASKFNK